MWEIIFTLIAIIFLIVIGIYMLFALECVVKTIKRLINGFEIKAEAEYIEAKAYAKWVEYEINNEEDYGNINDK